MEQRYTLRPGDFFWTGVGCIHGFHNASGGRVRWLQSWAARSPAFVTEPSGCPPASAD